MQARVDWVLIIFGTQIIKKKWPVWPVFPDYLSVSYDYDPKDLLEIFWSFDETRSQRKLLSNAAKSDSAPRFVMTAYFPFCSTEGSLSPSVKMLIQ